MQISTIGIDLAKNVFQIHGADQRGKAVMRKQLRREQAATFFANLSPCVIGIEACKVGASIPLLMARSSSTEMTVGDASWSCSAADVVATAGLFASSDWTVAVHGDSDLSQLQLVNLTTAQHMR